MSLISDIETALLDDSVPIAERRILAREIESMAASSDEWLRKQEAKEAWDDREQARETSDFSRNR